ncbi:MAG: rRNA maturation RNase YbeY [Bacteroidales bacterium]|nr:rRNA maturation RNase YbeY [Bacteroidales bacterium]
MIQFSFQTPFDFTPTVRHKSWLKAVIRQEKLQPGDIQYLFCDDAYLLERNLHFLQHDTLTDIITFDNGVVDCVSGEILISVERVRENAELLHTTFSDEMLRVIVHGVLHLCGYKDKTEEEAAQMRQLENRYMVLFREQFDV